MEPIHINSYTIFLGTKEAGKKFKVELSDIIRKKFQEPYDESNIKDVLNFALEYYSNEFEKICRNETSYEFYKLMFWLNEQSVELRRDKKAMDKFEDEHGREYFPIYRRILKLILEEACLINLVTEEITSAFKETTENTFDELVFLGDELLTIANLIAEQDMVGDVVAMDFTIEGVYQLKRKHFFELAFEKIVDLNAYEPESFVTDKNAESDFCQAVKDSFNVSFHDIFGIINALFQHRKLKKWDALAIGIPDIKVAMNMVANVPEKDTESFLSGLYFSKHEKIPIKKVIRKPYEIDRFLNRPILIWNIDRKDYCIICKYSMTEALDSLFHNAFPWNKAPKEWAANPAFKIFLAKKEREHEKMLLDKVEQEIKRTTLLYQPNVKKFKTKAQTIDIQNNQCGEIDFLVINLYCARDKTVNC